MEVLGSAMRGLAVSRRRRDVVRVTLVTKGLMLTELLVVKLILSLGTVRIVCLLLLCRRLGCRWLLRIVVVWLVLDVLLVMSGRLMGLLQVGGLLVVGRRLLLLLLLIIVLVRMPLG